MDSSVRPRGPSTAHIADVSYVVSLNHRSKIIRRLLRRVPRPLWGSPRWELRRRVRSPELRRRHHRFGTRARELHGLCKRPWPFPGRGLTIAMSHHLVRWTLCSVVRLTSHDTMYTTWTKVANMFRAFASSHKSPSTRDGHCSRQVAKSPSRSSQRPTAQERRDHGTVSSLHQAPTHTRGQGGTLELLPAASQNATYTTGSFAVGVRVGPGARLPMLPVLYPPKPRRSSIPRRTPRRQRITLAAQLFLCRIILT